MNNKGCAICKSEEKLLEKFDGLFSVKVKGNKLCIRDIDFISKKYDIEINYCPSCGRKLPLNGTENEQKDYSYFNIGYIF